MVWRIAAVAILLTIPTVGSGQSADSAHQRTDSGPVPSASRRVPVYPPILVDAKIMGFVELEYTVDIDGRIADGSVHVVAATNPQFATAVTTAARSWHFTPARRKGVLIAEVYRETFEFRLHDGTRSSIGLILTDTTEAGVPRSVIGDRAPDPSAARSFSPVKLAAIAKDVVLSIATQYLPPPTPLCVAYRQGNVSRPPDGSVLEDLRRRGWTHVEVPQTATDTCDRPTSPLVRRLTISRVEPWAADLVVIDASIEDPLLKLFRCEWSIARGVESRTCELRNW